MDFTIRPARAEDRDVIAAFTRDTFTWGDYVADQFDAWRTGPEGVLLVACDSTDRAIGMGRMAMLSQAEAWLQGMRVHPDARRSGIASALTAELLDAARARGARIARLAVEDDNEPAHRQVTAAGLRPASRWIRATREVRRGSPAPDGNGGRRVPPQDRLTPAPAVEAMPAFLSWTTGQLARPARGLVCLQWQWRSLTHGDLEVAARHDAFWMATTGWALAAPDRARLEVAWLETGESEAFELLRAIYELGSTQRLRSVDLTVPDVDWLRRDLDRLGFKRSGLTVYAKVL